MSNQTSTPEGLRATQEDRASSSSEVATGAVAPPAVGPDERKQMEQSAENYPCNKEEQKQNRQSADQQQHKDGNQMGAGVGAPVGASTNTQVQEVQVQQQQKRDKHDDDENNSSKENSGRKRTTSEEQASRTREAVQRVYQMLEKHKPATSCDEADSCEDSTASSTASTASSSPRRGGGANARSQQQRGASSSSSGYGGGGGGGGGGRGRQRRNNNSRRNQQQSGAQHATSNECDSSYGSSSSLNSIRSSSTRMSSSTNDNYNETETEEEAQLARLRCPSECTEAISEREKRRRKRCADYPGFALVGGMGSIFASDTMMRFSIIQNELHNVINGQLKRV